MSLAEQINPWSRTVVYLTMLYHDQPLATGTGMILKKSGTFNLLTALHNLTGREPLTGKAKHKSCALPNRVRIESYFFDHTETLYSHDNEPNDDYRFWVPSLGPAIDITLLRLNGCLPNDAVVLDESFLDPHLNESLPLYVSQTCHIVGFPEGLVYRSQPNVPLAVWKTGHIATEPEVDFQGEPVVIVDSTTRPGMSGAPVFVRNYAINGCPIRNRLVGIYTGRVGINDGQDSALGKVFKPRVVSELLLRGPAYGLLKYG